MILSALVGGPRVVSGYKISETPGLLAAIAGVTTDAGFTVSEENADTISAVYRAVDLIANAIKVLPAHVYERLPDGGKRIAADHPVYDVIHRKTNEEMHARRFWSYMQSCKLLWGNAYAEIERNRRGDTVALWPIHPRYVRVGRDRESGRLLYVISLPGSAPVDLDRTDIYHLAGPSDDGIVGKSVIHKARESLGLAMAADRFGARTFGNGAFPGGVLERPATVAGLTDKARANMRADLKALYSGEMVGSALILEEGTTWKTVGMPNDDMQFLETRQFQILEVARWFGVPPHKLAHLKEATFSNVEHMKMEFFEDCIIPHALDLAAECDMKLLDDDRRYFTGFDARGQMRGDHASRAEYYVKLWSVGGLTINEIRALEDMNGIGPAGDVHFVQLNMTTAERILREMAANGKDGPEDEKFMRELVKQLAADKTIGDVLFNKLDAAKLLTAVRLPMNPNSPEEPWLPVRDDAGQLVSGGVIRDDEGDVVGGKPIENEEGTEETGTEAQRDKGTEGEEDKGEEAKGTEAEGTEAQRGIGTEGQREKGTDEPGGVQAGGEQRISPLVPMAVAAFARLARKEINAFRRAASKHGNDPAAFDAWLLSFAENHAGDVTETVEPIAEGLAILAAGGPLVNPEAVKAFSTDYLAELTSGMHAAFANGTVETFCAERGGEAGRWAAMAAGKEGVEPRHGEQAQMHGDTEA